MQRIYGKILSAKESQMRDTIWYSMGSICSSASSMIILLIVTRIMGQEVSGAFSLAWSAAQLMLTIGWFNTRQYQVSDAKEDISYYEYFRAKIISSIAMLCIGLIYVTVYNYDAETKWITMFLCLLMVSDVFADFFGGFFQQNNRLYIGGMSYVIRNIGYLTCFSVTLYLWRNMIISVAFAICFVLIWLYAFDYQISKQIPKKNQSIQMKKVFQLFVECFPLFIGLFITSFITNVPKNTIDAILDKKAQSCYNILFMPTAVINMFNMFVSVPFYGKMAMLWKENKRKEFFSVTYKIVGIVVSITIMVLVGGGTLGIPILSWMYGVELRPHRLTFLIMILGGGFNGLISLLTYIITVFRKQKVIVYIYLIAAISIQLIAGLLVTRYELFGAALAYTIAVAVICIGLVGYIKFYLTMDSKKGDKN